MYIYIYESTYLHVATLGRYLKQAIEVVAQIGACHAYPNWQLAWHYEYEWCKWCQWWVYVRLEVKMG